MILGDSPRSEGKQGGSDEGITTLYRRRRERVRRSEGLTGHRIFGALAAACLMAAACVAYSHRTSPESNMQQAAEAFLAALGPDLAGRAVFPFNSEERFNWHYVPRDRKGVCFKEMNAAQQEA